jgi:hypothetical protein
MLAPNVDDTGVFARVGGGPFTVCPKLFCPWIVPERGRLFGADLGAAACLVGIFKFEGVFARGGGALEARSYNSSR